MHDVPPRPSPPLSFRDRIGSWLQWVGPGRVVATSFGVVAVVAAAYWLVRPPSTPTESSLPYTSSASGTDVPSAGDLAPPPSRDTVGDSSIVTLVVHVAGAVERGGVYRLDEGARVIDAVEAAGGLAANAEPDGVNLAALLQDGQRVYVPRVGEVSPAAVGGGEGAVAGFPIDLNRATAEDLDRLPGIGPATAAAIVAHREQHGPFADVDALADVRGIGPAKVDTLRGLVVV